ncbi:sulfotransferase, partial [Cellvibrio sp.]
MTFYQKIRHKMHFLISNRKPIIIGGFYRSGTSLVRRLLDSHSKIYCGPEVKFWPDLYADYKDGP